jgi:transposase
LADRPKDWRRRVEVVAIDGFSGFKTATVEKLPDAAMVMDPFHVVRLAGNALDECPRRVQLATRGHRGRKTHLLYACRLTTSPTTSARSLLKTGGFKPQLHRQS